MIAHSLRIKFQRLGVAHQLAVHAHKTGAAHIGRVVRFHSRHRFQLRFEAFPDGGVERFLRDGTAELHQHLHAVGGRAENVSGPGKAFLDAGFGFTDVWNVVQIEDDAVGLADVALRAGTVEEGKAEVGQAALELGAFVRICFVSDRLHHSAVFAALDVAHHVLQMHLSEFAGTGDAVSKRDGVETGIGN